MFKVFLSFLIFFAQTGRVDAQTVFGSLKDEQEKRLNEYLNASAVCAKMTDSDALYERGMLLLNDANDEAYLAAADCFTSAAMKNHTSSQLELGKLYESGNGVTQSRVYAYKWYQTAVLLGNKEALPFRNRLETQMSLDEMDLANTMIKDTLNLIEQITVREQQELTRQEKQIAEEYKKFGVDISEFMSEEEADRRESENDTPRIDSIILEHKGKETKRQQEIARRQQQDNSMDMSSSRGSGSGSSQKKQGKKSLISNAVSKAVSFFKR